MKPYKLLNIKNWELQQAQVLAAAAGETKGQFLSNISHEIRTPMNTIVGMADLLGETKLNEEQVQYVRLVKDSGNKLLVMVSDILELCDIENGLTEWNKDEFDFRVLVVRLERIFLYMAAEKKLRMELKIAPDVPRMVIGDSKKLNRILMNIVGNAIKFTDVGSVKVDIAVKALSKLGVTLLVRVQDTGIGISPDRIETLFQYFSQGDCSITRKHRGVGLGLALSKKLIKGMGGDIWVDSEVDKGSTFCFSLAFGLKENEILQGHS